MDSLTSRPRSLLIAAAALLLGLLLLVAQGPLSGLASMGLSGSREGAPSTAMFVPRRSPLALSLLINPDRLVKLPQVDLDNFEEGLLDSANLDYRRDVSPWLGDEVTLAVTALDLDRDASNGQQPGYLLALAAKNPTRAREFLQMYWQRRAADGTKLNYEQVSGVKLIYGESSAAGPDGGLRGENTIATALVGDRFVLFANTPKVVREAVNVVQVPELNLASNEDYQRSLDTLNDNRFAFAYANLEELGGWLNTQGLAVKRSLRSATAEADGQPTLNYQSLALALGATRQGLLADTALLSPASAASADSPADEGDSEMELSATRKDTARKDIASDSATTAETAETTLQPEQILQYLPSDSITAVSSTHLNELWQNIQPLLASYPALGTLSDRALDQVQSDWQIDITREIFPWVTGEYALGQLNRPDGVDWIFVADRSSPEAQAGIEHLDAIAREQGYSLGALILADRDVTAWTSLTPEGDQASAANAIRAFVRGVHAQVDHYELFATSLDAMERVLQTLDSTPLAQTKSFKQAVAPLPSSNQGYLYVNWQDNRDVLSQEVPILRVAELAAQPLFRTLKAASLSSDASQQADGIQRTAIALQLGR